MLINFKNYALVEDVEFLVGLVKMVQLSNQESLIVVIIKLNVISDLFWFLNQLFEMTSVIDILFFKVLSNHWVIVICDLSDFHLGNFVDQRKIAVHMLFIQYIIQVVLLLNTYGWKINAWSFLLCLWRLLLQHSFIDRK